MELPKDQEGLIKLAKLSGWQVSRTTSGHLKFESPQKKHVFGSGTPSDYRAIKNLRMQLKRAGLKPMVEEEKKPAVFRTPQIVIDKGALNLAAKPPPTPPPPKKMGGVRDAILDAMRRVNRGGGMEPGDLLTHVQAKIPDQTAKKIGVALAGMAISGWVIRASLGRYTVNPNPPGLDKGGRTAIKSPTGGRGKKSVEVEDSKALEEALAALTTLERIIRKHQKIAESFAGLKQMMGVSDGQGKDTGKDG